MKSEDIPVISFDEEERVCKYLPDHSLAAIRSILTKNGIIKAALFGSILREDFESGRSDIDLLLMFPPDTSLLEVVGIKVELEELLGVNVDVASWKGVAQSRNALRRKEIFSSARRIYEQAA